VTALIITDLHHPLCDNPTHGRLEVRLKVEVGRRGQVLFVESQKVTEHPLVAVYRSVSPGEERTARHPRLPIFVLGTRLQTYETLGDIH